MSARKTFFYSFIISTAVAMSVFGIMYFAMFNRAEETDTPQTGVPLGKPTLEDSKTLLVCTDSEYPHFFLFKFNAIENRVGIGVISPSYEISGQSMGDLFEKSGGMGCLLAVEEEFSTDLDYYLQASWQQLSDITGEMKDINIDSMGENLPDSIRNFLLKGIDMIDSKSLINAVEKAAGFMDNELGLGFMAVSRHRLIESNLDVLSEKSTKVIKENYSDFVTNINTADLNRMDRIINLLCAAYPKFESVVIIKGDPDAQSKIDSIIQ